MSATWRWLRHLLCDPRWTGHARFYSHARVDGTLHEWSEYTCGSCGYVMISGEKFIVRPMASLTTPVRIQ